MTRTRTTCLTRPFVIVLSACALLTGCDVTPAVKGAHGLLLEKEIAPQYRETLGRGQLLEHLKCVDKTDSEAICAAWVSSSGQTGMRVIRITVTTDKSNGRHVWVPDSQP